MTEALTPKPPGRSAGGRLKKAGRATRSGGGWAAATKPRIAAAALLAGEAETLTRKAVELALVGDPTALGLCLERVLPPRRDRIVKFALPPIESAPTGQSPWAEGPRYRSRDEGGYLGICRRVITLGRRLRSRRSWRCLIST